MSFSPLAKFNAYLHKHNLRNTKQRISIVETFLNTDQHLSAESLYELVRQQDASVGQTTVYRTVKHLCAAGLAREVRFDDGIIRYEKRDGEEHHDHLICEKCHNHIEVFDDNIEKLQLNLTKEHGFILTRHRLDLYGICPLCQKKT